MTQQSATLVNQNPVIRPQPLSKIELLALALLLAGYLVIALAHAALAPLTTGPDELVHYEYVNFIAQQGRLPRTSAERALASYKSDQPPLYHLLAALPARLVDPTGPPHLKRVTDHPRRQLIERTRHAWGLYNTVDERWPYRAEVLRWQVGRWVAILFGAATVAATFFIARQLFAAIELPAGRSPWLPALSAAAIVAFIPRFALTGSMLNYETTLAFFAALFLWLLLRLALAQRGEDNAPSRLKNHALRLPPYVSRFTFYPPLLLGLLAGLAITAKLSAIILPLEIALALWLIGRARGWSWRRGLGALLLAAAGTLAAVSWWFGFVVIRFNTVAQDGLWVGLLRPLIAADASDATTNRLLSLLTGGQAGFAAAADNLEPGPPWLWLANFFRTFWSVGIEQQQPLGWMGLALALALCLLAAAGLVVTWRNSAGQRLLLSLLGLHLLLPLALPLARYAATLSVADTAQGRHLLFGTAPAAAILLVWGLTAAARLITLPKLRPIHLAAAPLFLLVWTGAQLWTMTWAYLPLLPVSTRPAWAEAQVTHPAGHRFNEFVTLLGHQTRHDDGAAMLQVDLLWQAAGISPVDYLTELSLLDARGAPRVQWVGYPASGRYPTRAWDPGDTIRDTAWLPLAGLPQGAYTLSLTLRPTALTTAFAAPEPYALGEVVLAARAAATFNRALAGSGEGAPPLPYAIWQDGQPLSGPQSFRYRETVLVTLEPPPPGQPRAARLVGSGLSFAPVLETDTQLLFIVGPDWPSGEYQLELTLTPPGQPAQTLRGEPLVRLIDRWERQFTEPPISRRLEANFANQVKLLGYDLGSNRAEPGGGIPLTLYWQGLDWLENDYTIFAKLLAADQTVHGGRDRLPREGYRTIYWAPGEIVPDPFGLPVDADAPAGVYFINVGLYRQVGQQAVSLPLVQAGQPIDVTSVNLGPVKIGSAASAFALPAANPQLVLNQSFGNPPVLTLLGYDQSVGEASLHLTLYWRAEAVPPVDYTTFAHVRNAAGETVAQQDQPPLGGAYPTSLWEPGEVIADELVIPLPEGASAGVYNLVVGMYDFNTGVRLAVPGHPDGSLPLTSLELK